MAQTDIIARLQLKAEQFSSETGARFAEMQTRAQSTAQEVRQSFSTSFAGVQESARKALDIPRTLTGSLDLSSEIAQLETSRAAAERNAQGLREMSIAAEAAARAEGVNAQTLKLRSDAAAVAVLAGERNVAEIDQEIAGLRAMQIELNRTASATRQEAAALDEVTGHTGNATNAKMMLQHSIRSASDSFAAGLPPMMIFGEQIGRLGEAASMSGGALGKVGVFLGGPWGIALTASLAVLSPFIAKLWEGGDAADKQGAALKTLVGATEAYDRAVHNANTTQETANRLSEEATRKTLAETMAKRNLVATQIAGQLSQIDNAGGDIDTTGNAIAVSRLKGVLDDLDKQIAKGAASLREGQFDTILTNVAGATDKAASANQRYKQSVSLIRAELGSGLISQAQATAQLTEVTRVRDAVTKSTRAGVGASTALGDAEAKLSAAHGGAQRAEAELGVARARANADAKAGNITESERVARISAAESAVTRAKDAETALRQSRSEGAKETRAAAASQKEYGNILETLLAKYEPLVAAARNYRDEMLAIQHLTGGDKLTIGGDPTKFIAGVGDQVTFALGSVRAANDDAAKSANDTAKRIFGDTSGAAKSVSEALDRDLAANLDTMGTANGRIYGERFKEAAGGSLRGIAETLEAVTGAKIGSGPSRVLSVLGSNDNSKDPFTVGMKEVFAPLERALGSVTGSVDGAFKNGGSFKKTLGELAGGAALGGVGGSAFATITGGKDNKLASAAGGALGEIAGKELGKKLPDLLGKSLGGALGPLAGPLGSIAGGILGNVVSGLFNKPQKGGATITSLTGNATTFGNSAAAISAGSSSAKGVQQALAQIANQLGATTSGFSPITIGTYGKNNEYRINTTGGTTLGGSKNAIAGVEYFASGDEGQQAAIARAIQIEIEHGVIQGISQASQKIIASGQDLTTAINKAVLIESIPRDLKAALDPVGAAIDALNKKWTTTVAALNEGGASTEQMAQAQRLYQLQLDQTKSSTASASQSLKDFLTGMKTGSSSPFSLRDQEITAKAALQPYLDQIGSGSGVDQAKYQAAAQSFLDVERQLYGSTQAYFDALDQVQAATNKAISTIDNATPIAAAVADPFVKATADSTAATATGVRTVAEIGAQNSELLLRIAQGIESLGGDSSKLSTFIGSGRGYLAA